MKIFFIGFLLSMLSVAAQAGISESDLAELKGYTVLGSWTVSGWRDPGENEKSGTSFEGCIHNRIIVLEGGGAVKCDEYKYSYSYRPKAVIFGDGTSLKMVLDGQIYKIKI